MVGISTRAAVLTGGGGLFVAGADIRQLRAFRRAEEVEALAVRAQRLFGRIARLPFPMIAAVDGYALGGGNELQMACDLAVMVEDAFIRHVGLEHGSVPAGGATQWLPVFVGDRRAREIIFLCEEIPARKAEEWGLVNRVVPAEELDTADDAAVYRPDDERAPVFPVDLFPPVVGRPGDFGAVARAHALNDVFAMGGTPLLALSLAAFPEERPVEVLGRILAAADEQVRAAGALLAGGHTIRDAEPMYGLAVVGTVRPDAVWTKSTARPAPRSILTFTTP